MEMENRTSEEYSQELMSFAGDEEAFKEMARRYKAAGVREYHAERPRKRYQRQSPLDKSKTIWDNLFIIKK